MTDHCDDLVRRVRQGYDKAAASYTAARDQLENVAALEKLRTLLPAPATVLDVGCGAGVPVDRYLVDHGYQVIGIDISPTQIDLARAYVPQAQFEVKDMLDLLEGQYNVDGIVSFYAIFHTPRERHGALLKTLASFLHPGGTLLITMGASDWEGTAADFHGAKMSWSHFGPDKNRALVEAAGFAIEADEVVATGDDERHQVILARRR